MLIHVVDNDEDYLTIDIDKSKTISDRIVLAGPYSNKHFHI